ncbi:MAG: 3-deoxy-8-phosphooctulonate synthase [Planctomycetota bacterium]|nr:3-deoxy-8-phosphooctulonate synthase [Planctomycetota bacterium]
MAGLCRIGEVEIGSGRPLAVIAGPCTLESVDLAARVGERMRDACARLGLGYVFKASFDKANRTSVQSPRGPGLEEGLAALSEVKRRLGTAVTTDVHLPAQADAAGEVVDALQIPAFLCRQTDLLAACGKSAARFGRAVSVKKGQFLSPGEMAGPVGKLLESGCENVMMIERGTFFGYGRLVNDFLGLGDMMELTVRGQGPWPVCFDCTHSTQIPGAGATTGGRPERAALLARASVAAGVDAVFLETHPAPKEALSDAATMLSLEEAESLLESLAAIGGRVR